MIDFGPVAQRQSRGLIIPWFLVRIQAGPLDLRQIEGGVCSQAARGLDSADAEEVTGNVLCQLARRCGRSQIILLLSQAGSRRWL